MEKRSIDKPLWRHSEYASHYFAAERPHLQSGLRQAIGPMALQIGHQIEQQVVDELDLPFLLRTSEREDADADVRSDPAFLPFSPDTFSTVVLPHVLDWHRLPHQVLREAHRVLMSEGHIVLTGFNPMSLLGLQRVLRPKAVERGRYYTSRRVIDWLQLLSFEVVASSMFQYSPLSNSPRVQRTFAFLESVGDRWLPMLGGGYMIVARKRDAGTTMVGQLRFKQNKPKLAARATSAQTSGKHPKQN